MVIFFFRLWNFQLQFQAILYLTAAAGVNVCLEGTMSFIDGDEREERHGGRRGWRRILMDDTMDEPAWHAPPPLPHNKGTPMGNGQAQAGSKVRSILQVYAW